ncbi:MAG: histidinol dehydrogenase [Chitinophagaceae bacterium]|nr:histidinol dehydrogenase [Chitinophagaceae bacterium]
MQIIRYPSKDNWAGIIQRPAIDNGMLRKQVGKIIADVRKSGDRSLKRYSKKFDGVDLKKLAVGHKEILAAEKNVSESLKLAISIAIENIKRFHSIQVEGIKKIETMDGVECWRRPTPMRRVGLYIPGGSAPLFSTVLMLGIPAQIAGCSEVVLCTPPAKDGSIHPAILYAAQKVGVTEIYRCGGAQAIAAMAYGTGSIKKVDKIFGPGNQYVTAAKQLVQMDGIAIDMPAGPSEVCVLADDTANPDFVAADLLSQAEHGPDSQVLLVTNDETLIEKTIKSLNAQLELLERKEIALKALENSKALLINNMDDAMELVNEYAAEHLIIASDNAHQYGDKVINAGSVFLGNYTPESAGDYASGTNHTLPTNGYARAYSGVSVDSFVKKITFQQISQHGIQQIGKTIITMAEAEGLDAHANAVKIRLNQL